jgi:hypothetical protein
MFAVINKKQNLAISENFQIMTLPAGDLKNYNFLLFATKVEAEQVASRFISPKFKVAEVK